MEALFLAFKKLYCGATRCLKNIVLWRHLISQLFWEQAQPEFEQVLGQIPNFTLEKAYLDPEDYYSW